MSVMGRPASPGMSLMILAVGVVNRRTRSSPSRKSVAMSVLLSRFFMSLFDARQLVDLGLQLVVDRLQLLVERLHLLLRGRQLLVGGLQLFVGGLQLLVRRLELLLRRLHLLARGLHLLARALQLLAPAPPTRAVCAAPRRLAAACAAGRRRRRRRSRPSPSRAAPSARSSFWTVRSTRLRPAVGPHLARRARRPARLLAERRREGAGQLVAQPLARHREDVHVGLADRRLQVLAGAAADVEDVALVVVRARRPARSAAAIS